MRIAIHSVSQCTGEDIASKAHQNQVIPNLIYTFKENMECQLRISVTIRYLGRGGCFECSREEQMSNVSQI